MLYFCLSDLVCVCERLLRSDSLWALVHRPVQRGKSPCMCLRSHICVCELLSPLHYCERECVKTPPPSRSGKKLISRGTPDGSFTAARVSAILKNLPLIYDRLSSPYSLRAQNYVLNVLQQQTLMPERTALNRSAVDDKGAGWIQPHLNTHTWPFGWSPMNWAASGFSDRNWCC